MLNCERSALLAAAFTNGPAELIDFLIPLWAGRALGAGLADSTAIAFAAAVLGGVGGALLWVSLRATIRERLDSNSGVFFRLMSVQETGAWVAFVAGLPLLHEPYRAGRTIVQVQSGQGTLTGTPHHSEADPLLVWPSVDGAAEEGYESIDGRCIVGDGLGNAEPAGARLSRELGPNED